MVEPEVRAALRLAGFRFAGVPRRVFRPKEFGVRRPGRYEDWSASAAAAEAGWTRDPLGV